MGPLQSKLFLLQVAFPCEADLVIKICQFMIVIANTENLRQNLRQKQILFFVHQMLNFV